VFFSGILVLALTGYLVLVNGRRWRSLSLIGIIALSLALIAELVGQVYPVWDFVGEEKWLFISLSNSSIYTLSAVLFIQWYPFRRNKWQRLAYWLAWTTYSTALEWIYIQTGHMKYFENWTLWHSYAADWLLFWIYYQCYRAFQLEKLDKR
jgi:hypothetical protein